MLFSLKSFSDVCPTIMHQKNLSIFFFFWLRDISYQLRYQYHIPSLVINQDFLLSIFVSSISNDSNLISIYFPYMVKLKFCNMCCYMQRFAHHALTRIPMYLNSQTTSVNVSRTPNTQRLASLEIKMHKMSLLKITKRCMDVMWLVTHVTSLIRVPLSISNNPIIFLFFFSFWLKTQLSVSDREHVIYCANFISLIIKIIITIIIITLKFIYYCWHLSLTFILNFIISSSFFELCAHTTKTYRGWVVRQELCVIVSCRFRGEFCYVWLLSLIRRV